MNLLSLLSLAMASTNPCQTLGQPGYVFVRNSCFQTTSESPSGPCEVAAGTAPNAVWFISEVVYDTKADEYSPDDTFYDKIRTLGVTKYSGLSTSSACYESRSEADAARSALISDLKRKSAFSEPIFHTISLPDPYIGVP